MNLRKQTALILFPMILLGILSPLFAQKVGKIQPNVTIKETRPELVIERQDVAVPLFKWGNILQVGDTVKVSKNGTARIQFPLSATESMIQVGGDSSLGLSTVINEADVFVYLFTLQTGRLQTRIIPSKTQVIRVRAGSTNIVSATGEYIVEQFNGFTLVVNVAGTVRVYDRFANDYIPISPHTAAYINQYTGKVDVYDVKPSMVEALLTANISKSMAALEIAMYRWHEEEEIPVELEVAIETKKAEDLAEEEGVIEMPVIPVEDVAIETVAAPEAALDSPGKVVQSAMASDETRPPQDLQIKPSEKKTPATSPQKPIVALEERDASEKEVITQESNDMSPEETPDEPGWLDFVIENKWHVTATTSFVVFGYLAYSAASEYNSLSSRNDALSVSWASVSSTSERAAIESEFNANKETMKSIKPNIDLYNALSLIALGVEGYLLYREFFSEGEESAAAENQSNRSPYLPEVVDIQFDNSTRHSTVGLSATWHW